MRFLARVFFTIGLSLVALSGKLYVWPSGGEAATGETFNLKERTDSLATQVQDFMDSRKTPRDFLPQAPADWSRRAFVWDDRTRMPGLAGVEEEMLGYSQFFGTKAVGLKVNGPEKTFTKQKARTTWMYEKGDLLVEMTAIRPKPVQGMKMQQDAMRMVSANKQVFQVEEPFGVVQGVVWKKVVASTSSVPEGPTVDWTLAAQFGDIHLYARGQGVSEDEMRAFLGGIDYDGLNRMLDTPLPNVGSAAPELTAEQQLVFARAEMDQQRRGAAEAARQARQDLEQSAGVADLAEAGTEAPEAPATEVRVNRFGGRASRKSACGGTSFCSVSGD